MAERQFILVVYDISDDRRRTKLHNALLDFGTPVQYSVFECLLDKKGEKRLRAAVRRVIRPKVDRVRFYWLCTECQVRVEVTSGPEVLGEPPAVIIAG
jgi:CRISPR-associated protein Cas2